MSCRFIDLVSDLSQNKDRNKLETMGGTEGLAKALLTSTSDGVTLTSQGDQSLEHRQRIFGANAFKEAKQKAFWSLLLDNLKDPTLILLMLAALVEHAHSSAAGRCSWLIADLHIAVFGQVSTVLGAAIKEEREQSAWTEGVAIWVAVIVVSGVGVYFTYSKLTQNVSCADLSPANIPDKNC